MAAAYDEYEYLERQVDAQRADPFTSAPAPPPSSRCKSAGGTTSDDDNNRRRRPRSRSRDRKSRRYSRSRSRSRDRRRRSRSRSRDRSRSYSERYRSSYRSPPRRRSPTPPAERMAREKERELRELERATRTIFAYNLSLRADERDLFEFFSKVGRVVDIKLITDKNTKRSRGLAYIEFSKVEEVISAVALTGNILKGQPVMVKASEAEKNMAWEAAQQQKQSAQAATQQLLSSLASSSAAPSATTTTTGGPCWLTVSNLHKDLGEAEVQQLFAPFGALTAVQIARDAAGRSSGVVQLQFAHMDAAARAMAHWHGRKLMDAQLTVAASAPPLASLVPGGAAAAGLLPVSGLAAAVPPLPAAVAPTTGAAAATAAQGAAVTPDELDEDEGGGGIRMSAQGRVALMSKLAGAAGLPAPPTHVTPTGLPLAGAAAAASAAGAVGAAGGLVGVDPAVLVQQGVLGPGSPIAAPCLLLKNMFDEAAAAAGDAAALAEEVEADVREECARFGELVHVWVDARAKGFVYLRFTTTQAAEAAHRALHGRWYGGRQIVAEYQFLQVYNSHFKLPAVVNK